MKRRKPTLKQEKFIEKYLETGNATESASQVYDVSNRHVAQSIGTENLSKPVIAETIEDRIKNAKNMIYTIAMTGEKEETRLKASQDIIDRGEGKPVSRTEISGKDGNAILIDISEEQARKIAERIIAKK